MEKKEVFIGILIGLIAALIGTILFILIFTDYEFLEGIRILKSQNSLGKLIALGAVLNIITFFVLLKLKKELMARGVVLATVLVTLITLFV
ncbi:hypothetical protein [Flavobacterium sp.]|jgi:hypothetical protein|uniref:hypothetical protein n=1 Tax=Flavobacterium sp. TaxID=239 RepID=UPI0037C18B87